MSGKKLLCHCLEKVKRTNKLGLFIGALLLFFCTQTPVNAEESYEPKLVSVSNEPAEVLNTENKDLPAETKPEEKTEEDNGNENENVDTEEEKPSATPESETQEPKPQEEDQNEKQDTDYSCGPASLVTWIRLLGGEATEQELIELAKTNAIDGTTFLNLREAAKLKGYTNATVYKLSLENIDKLTLPALIYLNVEGSEIGHYAVLWKIEGNTLYIKDPIKGSITISKENFTEEFGEYAMINGTIEEVTEDAIQQEKISETSIPPVEKIQDPTIENQEASNPIETMIEKPIVPIALQNSPPKPRVATDEELANVKGKGGQIRLAFQGVSIVIELGSKVVKIAYHGAHHTFKYFGKLNHIQITSWVKGVKKSGKNWRIPLPW